MSRGRRVAKWLVRTVLFTVVGGTLYVATTRYFTRRAGEQKLAAVVAELDAADPGWRLDDLLAEREKRFPPDDQNIMAVVQRVFPRQPKLHRDWGERNPDWLPTPDFNRRPDPLAMAEARCVREELIAEIEAARRIRRMNSGGYKLVVPPVVFDTLLEPTQNLRVAAAVLHLDALTAADAGDFGRAVDSTHACLACCRGLDGEPTLISQLVRLAVAAIAAGTAERVLAWGEPAAGLAELQQATIVEADAELLAVGLRGERAMFDKLFANLDAGVIDTKDLAGDKDCSFDPAHRFGTWVYGGYLPGDRAYALDLFNRLIEICRLPIHERKPLFDAVPVPPKDREHMLSNLLIPAWFKIADAELRVKARLRCTTAGIACERYRQKYNRWPAALADIPADILPAVPLDPYDGQSLRYAATENGVVVYSVGPDLADDGGTLSYGQPQPGEDVGSRLWDVRHRRAE